VIITGMPGAGKTTITDLVGRLLPRGAQVGGDAGDKAQVLSPEVA